MAFDLKTDDGLRRACGSVDFDSEGLVKDRIRKDKNLSRGSLPTHRVNSLSARNTKSVSGKTTQFVMLTDGLLALKSARVTQDERFSRLVLRVATEEIWSLDSQDRTESLCEFVKMSCQTACVKYSLHASTRPPPPYRHIPCLGGSLSLKTLQVLLVEGELYRLAKHMGSRRTPSGGSSQHLGSTCQGTGPSQIR